MRVKVCVSVCCSELVFSDSSVLCCVVNIQTLMLFLISLPAQTHTYTHSHSHYTNTLTHAHTHTHTTHTHTTRHTSHPNTNTGPEGPGSVEAVPAGTGEWRNGTSDSGDEVEVPLPSAGHAPQYQCLPCHQTGLQTVGGWLFVCVYVCVCLSVCLSLYYM